MQGAFGKYRSTHAGQSLLEVIVALAIFALISAAMVTMTTGSFISLEQGGEQTEAEALAQEGIEAVRAIRDGAWNELIYTTSSVSISGNKWIFDGETTTETIGKYTRIISFEDVCRDANDDITDCPGSYTDLHSKKVTVTVSWDIREGIVNQVQKITYLTNWDSREWVQTDWVGGNGQVIWSDNTRYDNADGVVDVNAGQVTLDQTTDTSASTTWPFDITDNYTYVSTSIKVAGGVAGLVGTSVGFGNTSDDGFEYTTDTSYDWPFTTAGNYTYDTDVIGVTEGVAQLKVAVGGSCSGTSNACNTFSTEGSCSGQSGCSWAGGNYPTSAPAIYPTVSYSAPGIQSWTSFTETATKNGGEIYYQLSDDNGTTWQYWTGLAWATAGVSNYNTASIINTNISSFSTSIEQVKFRAFLESDGIQQVQLDNVNIGLTPSAGVWSFVTWDIGGGEVTPTGLRQTSGGNPDNYAEITVPSGSNDEIGGYWEQAFTTTEDNPDITIDFDYKVFDFNSTPNVSKIRVYVDSASGDPVNQVGDAITISAEGDWTSATTITTSTVAETADIYYLKIAYWVETPTGGSTGPFIVGFDNVSLSWQANSYPTDKPTISNTTSFTPATVQSWTSFTETAIKNGGEIYYQLSNDDGATWQYWDGDSWETAGASDYNTASVMNSAIQYFDTAAKKLMFQAFLESDGTQQVELDNIDVTYNLTDVTYAGNQFIVDSTSGVGEMSKSNDKTSLRFTAKNSKSVNTVRVYLEQEKGTSPTYRYGLQSDNSGQPSGTWLGASNQGFGDHQAIATGWQTIALNENINLTEDTVYHLVVEYQSGTINGGNMIELRRFGPINLLHAEDSTADVQGNIFFFEEDVGSWAVQNYQPIYALDFVDASYEGNPYHEAHEHEIYGDLYYGQQFTVTGSYIILSSVGMSVSENNQGPEADLILTLYDVTSSTLLTNSILTTSADIRNGVYSWQEFYFDQPLTLEVGKTYRIYISSPDADETAHYLIHSGSHDNNAALNSINYGGTESFYISSINGGSSWDTTAINQDLSGFRFQQTIFNTSGYVISSAYNMGLAYSVAQIISWDQITPECSIACEVKLQIQTAPDNGGSPDTWLTTWCGPDGEDGDETDFYTTNTGELIHVDHIGDQWIRYKATLVGDSTDTPTFEEIRVNYK